MDRTPNLDLPFLAASQSQKHVTLNDSLSRVDVLAQLVVQSRSAERPVDAPAGTCYIAIGSDPEFSADQVVAFIDGTWRAFAPRTGWLAHIVDEQRFVVYDGTSWSETSLGTPDTLGINTTADSTNRLALSSPASLFTHEGAGHQAKINKASSGDTSSVLFQSDWNGRAEMGLVGDDDFQIKVSPDGESWTTAFQVNSDTGRVSVPHGVIGAVSRRNWLINALFRIQQRIDAGGTLPASQIRHDGWRAGAAGCDYAVSGGVVTLTTGELSQVVVAPLRAGDAVTFSCEVHAGGNLTVTCLGETLQLSPDEGRQAVTFNGPLVATEMFALTLSGDGASFSRPKLEIGGFPTGFEPVPDFEDLAACRQRYDQFGPGPSAYNPVTNMVAASTTMLVGYLVHTPMRAIPTVTFHGNFQILGFDVASEDMASMTAFTQTNRGFELRILLNNTVAAQSSGLLRTENYPDAYIALDAEPEI